MVRQKHTERRDKKQKERDRKNSESGKKTNNELGINRERERERERENVKKKEFVLQSDKMKVVVISFGKKTRQNFKSRLFRRQDRVSRHLIEKHLAEEPQHFGKTCRPINL